MDKAKARDLFETACQKVGEDLPPHEERLSAAERVWQDAAALI